MFVLRAFQLSSPVLWEQTWRVFSIASIRPRYYFQLSFFLSLPDLHFPSTVTFPLQHLAPKGRLSQANTITRVIKHIILKQLTPT